jgi:hypothetical protein
MFKLHDWSLVSIEYEWKSARCELLFLGHKSQKKLIARDVRDLRVPRRNDWGLSESVNTVSEPVDVGDGMKSLTIEMQSGDEIALTAVEFELVGA